MIIQTTSVFLTLSVLSFSSQYSLWDKTVSSYKPYNLCKSSRQLRLICVCLIRGESELVSFLELVAPSLMSGMFGGLS